MEVISFDLSGKFAHFRKYYANNTALSYALPPRTAIMGIVAAILGLPRDSYYRQLASNKIRFGIRILSPVKKSFHRVNLLMIKGENDFRGRLGRTQIPFEVVTGLHLGSDLVVYRIFISSYPEGEDTFRGMKDVLSSKKPVYNLTLGTANFHATLSNFRIFKDNGLKLVQAGDDFVEVHSTIRADLVSSLDLSSGKLLLEEELIPADFMDDFNRELSAMQRILFTLDGRPIRAKIKGEYFQLTDLDSTEQIMFLE